MQGSSVGSQGPRTNRRRLSGTSQRRRSNDRRCTAMLPAFLTTSSSDLMQDKKIIDINFKKIIEADGSIELGRICFFAISKILERPKNAGEEKLEIKSLKDNRD